MENDHRSPACHRILKAATISFGGGAISCAVRNLSDGGASLEVELPSEFLNPSFSNWTPAFSRVAELNLRYLPYSELRDHRATIERFGEGLKGMLAISRSIAPQAKYQEGNSVRREPGR